MKKVLIGILGIIGLILILYLGISAYFMDHLYFNSSINSVNVSCDTVSQATVKVENKIKDYKIELILENGEKRYITSNDIGFNNNIAEEVTQLKDKQKPFAWIYGIFDKNYTTIDATADYDKTFLNNSLNKVLNLNEGIAPKNPAFKYVDGHYEVVKEVYGNKINVDKLDVDVLNAVETNKKVVDLKADGCYETPKYTESSTEVAKAKDLLNKYVDTKITFTFGDDNTVLNGDTINKWLDVNNNMEVIINNDAVTNYVKQLASKYNTVGKARPFKTSLGATTMVSGGDYGWKLNQEAETEKIIETIKNGESTQMDLIFSQKGEKYGQVGVSDNYVEINLKLQKVWVYKDGKAVVETNVVTGNVSKNDATPAGFYYIKYKEKDTHLKGKDYDVPVKFWMPFNGGIGLHDASWRDKFGGDIYLKSGSHGCVNLPPNIAGEIFNNISTGTPVVCYN